MVHVDLKDLYSRRYILLWSILSFKAGLLNSAGFFIVGSYVAHVTGFGTQIGIALGHDEYTLGLELLIIPTMFIGGAFLTALVLDKNYSREKIPNYPIIQIIITALIGIISLSFKFGYFEMASLDGKNTASIILIGLLCLICGLKNGLTTWASHGKIRTTHLTGLSTDIGLHLPKLFLPEGSQSRYQEPKIVNLGRICILISFFLGACISALLIPKLSYKIFYVSFFISLGLSVISIVHRKNILTKKN